ncbi:MAG: Sugar isomerase (SIS), partial [uncultured Thermomicrobiales bacterium]
ERRGRIRGDDRPGVGGRARGTGRDPGRHGGAVGGGDPGGTPDRLLRDRPRGADDPRLLHAPDAPGLRRPRRRRHDHAAGRCRRSPDCFLWHRVLLDGSGADRDDQGVGRQGADADRATGRGDAPGGGRGAGVAGPNDGHRPGRLGGDQPAADGEPVRDRGAGLLRSGLDPAAGSDRAERGRDAGPTHESGV